jgi:hypothetical protein
MDDITEQIWYKGTGLREPGILMTGFIVDCKTNTGGRWKIRVPAIHGYADVNGEHKEDNEITSNEALPLAPPLKGEGLDAANNNLPSYKKGQFVIIRFTGPNFTNPVILYRTEPANPILGEKNTFTQEATSHLGNTAVFAEIDKNAKQFGVASADNGCYKVVPASTYNRDNGTDAGNADKCGAGPIKDGFAANIADFLKIIQDTDGKVGSKFINKYTGELFEITGYIQKYLSAISGIFRSSLQWIKSIITKYVKRAIDQLVKLIMQPIKGITKVVNETLEKALQLIACSFGDIEKLIENLLTSLLESLTNTAINAVFGCLDTLVDGILNEIISEILSLMNTIMASISAIAGIIGGFGDLIGEALASILDFLGISCGGAGDCTVSGQKSAVNKFNTPGEYGFPSGLKRTLNGGLSGIGSLTSGIDSATAANIAESYSTGVNLGTNSNSSISTDNPSLTKAFTTAESILSNQINNTIVGFCNSITNPTVAVVFGSPQDKYDSVYSVYPTSTDVVTGSTQSFKIRRNNNLSKGIINFVAYLKSGDTARVVGITPGLTSGGDLDMNVKLSPSDFCKDTTNPSRSLPIAGNIIVSRKVEFNVGEKEKIISIPSKVNFPINSITDSVTYTVGIFRCTDDLDNKVYRGLHTPNRSSSLNTVEGKITFSLSSVVLPETNPPTPLTINYGNVYYNSSDVSVVAGSDANFTITRTPVTAAFSQIKCETFAIDAVDGTHYSGGYGLIDFLPGQASATFAVKTLAISGVTDIKQFGIKITDTILPDKITSNLGGTGYTSSTSTGPGITYNGTINYNLVPVVPSGVISPNPSPVIPTCPPEIVITAQPPSCIVQPDTIPLSIGLIAKTTVPGYTLNYQWQRTYNPSSGWTNILNGLYTTNINKKVTTWGSLGSYVVSGVTYTLSGWTTGQVNTNTSTTFAGANSPTLTINPLSYLINDEEYYRCVISGIPVVVASGSPLLTEISEQTYVGVTSSGVYLTTVNCSPVAPSGTTVIVYSGTTPSTTNSPVVPSGSYCVASPSVIPLVPSGVTPTSGTPTASGTTTPTNIPTVPSGLPIIPTPAPDPNDIPTIIPVVDPDGGVASVPIPDNLPAYKFPPLIPITGAGFGAVARAELDENGYIRSIVVKSKGIGYEPTETGLCGILDSIELTTVGAYYESSPIVYIDDDDSIATAAIDENGRVVEIRITNPQGKVYNKVPRVDIIGTTGLGASGIAVLRHVDCATVNDEYLNVVNKYNTSKVGTVKVVDCP